MSASNGSDSSKYVPVDIPETWSFKNESVASNFNSHVREQLPWYDHASRLVSFYAQSYLMENDRIYDLGCSTGHLANLLKSHIIAKNVSYIGVDNSQQILDNNDAGLPTVCKDIVDVEFDHPDVIISFLTLVFLSPKNRQKLLSKAYESLPVGGALIILERFQSPTNLALTSARLVLSEKTTTGDEIVAKDLSLIGSQRVLSEKELPGSPQIVFAFADFKCYIIEKT